MSPFVVEIRNGMTNGSSRSDDPLGRRRQPQRRRRHGDAGRGDEPPGETMMREKIGACRSAEERDEDRDAERLAYVAKCGVYGRAGREAVGGQTCDRGRSEE